MNFRRWLFTLCLPLFATAAQAQFELKTSNFNPLYVPQTAAGAPAAQFGPPVGNNNGTLPATFGSNYQAMGQVAGSAGPVTTSAIIGDRFPSTPDNNFVLLRSTYGSSFSSGVPRYMLGDIITPPLVKANGITPAPANYWRIKPVEPGETIPNLVTAGFVTVNSSSTGTPNVTVALPVPTALVSGATLLGRTVNTVNTGNGAVTLSGGNANTSIASPTQVSFGSPPSSVTPIPVGTVNVTASNTTTTSGMQVTVATVPAQLVVGATMLGQPITAINGAGPATVTLAGPANQTITSSTPVSIIPALTYYYSPHAEKVFASQAGRVTIIWETLNATENGGYETLQEIFAVSSNTSSPVRTIFWTEGSFDGPKVQITDSRITTVNPAFYSVVPKAVASEVVIPGYTPVTPNLTTLSFDKYNGIGQLHAYNVEGRIFVEYLGNIRLAGNIYESVGHDVIDIVRVPAVSYPTVNLGKELTPHNGNGLLQAYPVLSGAQAAVNYYGTSIRPDGSSAYFAERETSPPNNPENGAPASTDAYNKVVLYWMETGQFSIQWPVFQDRYWQRWSPSLSDYAHYTVESGGSSSGTGMPFTGGSLPTIVYQDDPAQMEARIDINTQRLFVNFAPGADQRNRALLKFSSGGKDWYVNLYTQAENREYTRSVDANGTSTVTLTGGLTTEQLENGMIVTGPGINGTAYIVSVIDSTHFVLSQNVSVDTSYHFTVESDNDVPINSPAIVGTRLLPPAGHEEGGYIAGGTGYYPAGYLNPFVVGVDTANKGAIIPVNALPTNNLLTVRWFKKIPAPSAEFQDLYVPGKFGRYTVGFPASTTPQIVIAQGVGTDDLPPAEAAGSIYYQNNPGQPGYNPNEEHALMLGGRAYALREDLNVTGGPGYTSQPCVLVAYKDPADDRPAMHAYRVVRTGTQNGTFYDFDYTATAGTLLVKVYPLPLMPLPMVGTGANRTSKDLEIIGADNPANATVGFDDAYRGFTFKDRKGFTWIHRGPHEGGSPTLSMKLYYLSRAGFYVPGIGEPAVGTVLPFLRTAARSGQPLNINAIDNGQTDQPLTIVYRPTWPTDAPELRVGETLTLPKFGLPQVRGQTSAQIYYQQSIAVAPTASLFSKNSVTLHDPTREKTIPIDSPAVGLAKLPTAIRVTSYQGKTYFQNLPPHLQQRFFLDPQRGAKGTLILLGEFHDEIAGDDYLDLNVLSDSDEEAIKGLVPVGATDKAKWDSAINALKTRVETFKPDPAQFGSYIVDPAKNLDYGPKSLAVIKSPNAAVDSYALSATGQGTGFVTMVFGNGNAFTPEGDPVAVQVFKISNQLYVGDLKVVTSSNPLDEQVTLRHSGDFAGQPEDYEFEWRWATGEASAPATYSTVMTPRLGDPAGVPAPTDKWYVVSDPGAVKATPAQYTAGPPVILGSRNVHPVNYVMDAQNQPTDTVIAATSYTAAEIAAGYPALMAKSSTGVNFTGGVPGSLVFSADVGTHDGFVLYVNGTVALAHNAPSPQFTLTQAGSGLTENGLSKQFALSPGFFTAGPNTIEIAIYTTADPNAVSALNFMLEAAEETDLVVNGTTWQIPSDPTHKNTNFAIVGGSPLNPFGGPQFVLNDRWFTMRYRPKASANNVLGTPYSRWMPPQFVEGWVKRVLAAINPFEQRVKDLYNNQINSDVSVLTQAGKKWEGDIALTMDNINDAGLIEIYETVLNRAKSMSIDANTNDPDTNNALLLAAGYLNDLYTILGNEAFADAANPTISLDDQTTVTEVNTNRFSFEGQVASSLDEELALLRGRDDFVSPGVQTSPAYNRLYWNYTHGINSGEVLYAVNYNVKEKVGSSTANGVIDEADAQRMFPQGHGDAYGHYLTALTGYYRLLTNTNFTWTPRAEAVTVAGQPVTVDFMDERKFAAAAGHIAQTAQEIVALVFRQTYKDDPATGWSHYRDSKGTNTSTGVTSRQGLDEWVSRAEQGAYLNWVVGNALVPDEDTYHTGVQKIDRTTVPELQELATAAETLQTTIDNANAHLNPLGLSPGAIAFDISPGQMTAGQSHFEQIYDRALRSLSNAAGAFNQVARMSRSLRNQENQIDDYNNTIAAQETAYVHQLIDIYGRPYSGDIGPGKLYAQGYAGPDLEHWFIVDRPTDLVKTGSKITVSVMEPAQLDDFTGIPLDDVLKDTSYKGYVLPKMVSRSVTVQPSQIVQYNDVWSSTLGSRSETGELQNALQDAQQTFLALYEAGVRSKADLEMLQQKLSVFNDYIKGHKTALDETASADKKIAALNILEKGLTYVAENTKQVADTIVKIGEAIAEFFPTVLGFANDATSGARGAAKTTASVSSKVIEVSGIVAKIGAMGAKFGADKVRTDLNELLMQLSFNQSAVQMAYEVDNTYRTVITHGGELAQLALAHQRALQNVQNVMAKGNRVLAEREIFRQRAAAIIQGYRTRDVTFRLFRNESLQQYRSLFDLASRYTYLAAKSYDYETGLLGGPGGQSVFNNIVAARSLGDITAGTPMATVSSLGDSGLAGTMAKLNADFSVAEGRLGINNPDQNGTVFSMRSELFRIRTDAALPADDDAWRQTLEQHIVANVLSDADIAAYCRNIRKADGTPVPGIVIPFSTTIQTGYNFFGLPLAPGDHAYTASNFATKVYSAGVAIPGYVGMDAYAFGNQQAGSPASSSPNALSATPYVYLIPCGSDYMLAPPLGDTNTLRVWDVKDQALPLPYNLGATAFNTTQFFDANGTLSEQPWIARKHQAFRAVSDPAFFFSTVPAEFTNSRLIARSVWNSQWKLVIPAFTLLNNEQDGLNRFVASVKDLQLFLRTYSNSGN